jgi:hypothetical protein
MVSRSVMLGGEASYSLTSMLIFLMHCAVNVGFGTGVFIDMDKDVALRLTPARVSTAKPTARNPAPLPITSRPTTRRPTSRPTTRRPMSSQTTTCIKPTEDTNFYGRISRDDFKKIINKKDLFQICAAAAGGLTADSAGVGISGVGDEAKKYIPKLVIGHIDAIVKKEVSIGATSKRKGRRMKESDRRRLESSIEPYSHRALRMLSGCAEDILPDGFGPSCTVQQNGFACAKLSNIQIDGGGLRGLVGGVLGKLVVPDYKAKQINPGLFDEIAQPLLILDERLPGISDLSGKRCVPSFTFTVIFVC